MSFNKKKFIKSIENLSLEKYPFDDWKGFDDWKSLFNGLDNSWKKFFNDMNDFDELFDVIKKKIKNDINNGHNIFPYPELVFNALKLNKLKDVKCCVFLQDPYINSANNSENIKVPQAMGLALSAPKDVIVNGSSIPPSLKNLYNNMVKFDVIKDIPKHGNISSWATQGVLLLNSALTTIEGKSNEHQNEWKKLTDRMIKYISKNCENVVFMLWGGDAFKKIKFIDRKKHFVTCSTHPSPMSFHTAAKYADAFKNVDHFNNCNNYLIENNKVPINWNSIC